jgi:hypothetical protein
MKKADFFRSGKNQLEGGLDLFEVFFVESSHFATFIDDEVVFF